MKMADVEVGQEYAWEQNSYTGAKRVVVVRARVHRGVWTGWGTRRSERPDGIHVVVLDRKTGEPQLDWKGKVGVREIMPRYLTRTWQEQLEIDAMVKDRNEKAEIRFSVEWAALADQVDLVNKKLGGEYLKVHSPWKYQVEVALVDGTGLVDAVLSLNR